MPRDLFAQPLFSPKLLKSRFAAQPLPETHRVLIEGWHNEIKGKLGKEKEEAIVSAFLTRFFISILGYAEIGSAAWTLDRETRAANGKVDAALGTFTYDIKQVVAPFELKGLKTSNLDALMPARLKSPVQQAWEYANDLPGSQFVLVSNCDEIRLYALGCGRAAYECWHISDLLEPQAYANFVGLLGQHNLTSGNTQRLLKDNALQEREVTEQLYTDYKALRQELILGLHHQNPIVDFADLVRHAQKLIDRLLFIAFAESRGLLPSGAIAHAVKNVDVYNPQPKWHNFRGLFKAVDVGNPYLKIPPYNGGLFAPDADLDNLQVSDQLVEKFSVLAGYDYEQEVSVTVLGRIFEQSISDLEHIANLGNIDNFKLSADKVLPTGAKKGNSAGVAGKRKRDGVVYTPDHITRFIVDKTLTPVIADRFNALHAQYHDGTAWRKASNDEKSNAPLSTEPDNITEYWFWKAWEASLTTLRVCDPACGSGAFLVAAFDVLKEQYKQLRLRLKDLAPQLDLKLIEHAKPDYISHTILRNNLFGVDINAESIEITKLSLWLKTAERGHKLAGLEANFYQGNSLVTDPSLDPQAFDWQAHFNTVFTPNKIAPQAINTPTTGQNDAENAGFDVILGNPPYVRQELFTNLKPYLQQHYSAYHGVADLYVYFYELGLCKLLRTGGRLGFISSSSFFKTSSGEPLRRLLRQQGQIETLVDFGDWQVFEGVTIYPAIVVVQKTAPDDNVPAQFLQLSVAVPDLTATFEESKQSLNTAQLSGADGIDAGDAAEWQLEGNEAAALRDKLTHGHASLKEVFGSPLYGIKTGLNEAFVIDRATRDRLVFADPESAPLFKPFLEGKDIKRWQVESEDRWLILLPKGWTKSTMNMPVAVVNNASIATNYIAEETAFTWLQTRHPHLAAYLAPFADAARKRTDKGEYWWELRACAYYEAFDKPKIFYPVISQGSKFLFDTDSFISNDKGFIIPTENASSVAILNSKAIWFVIQGICSPLRGGIWRYELRGQNIETLPIPTATNAQQSELTHLATACAQAAKERLAVQRRVGRRILELLPVPAPKGAQANLGDKLGSWWLLDDFKAFHFEVQKRFKTEIPLRERNDWEQLFNEEKTLILQLSANLAATERSIDAIVYNLFKLNAAEIALIERAVKR